MSFKVRSELRAVAKAPFQDLRRTDMPFAKRYNIENAFYEAWRSSKPSSTITIEGTPTENLAGNEDVEEAEQNVVVPPPAYLGDRVPFPSTKSSMGSEGITAPPFGRKHDPTGEHSIESPTVSNPQMRTTVEIDVATMAQALPPLKGLRFWREARYKFWSVYRRLCASIIIANIAIMVAAFRWMFESERNFTYKNAATAAGANLLAATIVRHEHFVNLLFNLVCKLPPATPLFIRRQAGQIYHYGGVHAGCGIGALLWYAAYTVLVIADFCGTTKELLALAATSAVTLLSLTIIVLMSYPEIRKRWHDQWELSHRYGGWLVVGLVWAQTAILAVVHSRNAGHSVAQTLLITPTFWCLITITLCLFYPWIRVRRAKVESERLSDHSVLLRFHSQNLAAGVVYRLSHSPLVQNHAFATIPDRHSGHGHSILVSRAGDWTNTLINNPPSHIWTRGAPFTGFIRVASLFRPVVFVATGAGIGPCLSFLHVYPEHPVRVIWSVRSPVATYGLELVRTIQRADHHAIVIDTKISGHSDLVACAYAVYREVEAEAVFVVSNATVTSRLVYELEARHVAAFGPIFDS